MGNKTIFSKDVKHLYTEDYFLNSVSGHSEFKDFEGKYSQLLDKFQFGIDRLELDKAHSLLDIGCGRGEIVIYHSLNGGKSTGVDFSEEAIKLAEEKAKELNAECRFNVNSFENIDEDIKYDRIMANDFIEHISAEEGIMFFKKCYTLLNPGGRLLIYTFPNTIRRKYGYKLLRITGFIRNKPLPEKEPDTVSDHYKQYHLNEQNYFSLKNLAKNGGFREINVVYFDSSVKDSFLKTIFIHTPLRHLFLKGLTLIADK